MRVIAGKYKKTPLKTLEGMDITRPTRDMVKEALFSTISIYSDTTFLDLFSGSGAIGIEALSRGAKDAVFNDANRQACQIIQDNLEKVREKRTVFFLDYAECLFRLKDKRFDYIYVDPPYRFEEYDRVASLVRTNNVLAQDGTMIIEVRKERDLPERYDDLCCCKEKKYGINKLLYYRYGDKE